MLHKWKTDIWEVRIISLVVNLCFQPTVFVNFILIFCFCCHLVFYQLTSLKYSWEIWHDLYTYVLNTTVPAITNIHSGYHLQGQGWYFFYLFFLVLTVPEMNIIFNISTSLTSSVHSKLAPFFTHNSTSLKFPSVAAVRSFWKKITAFTFLTWTYECIIIVKKK